ncbi:GNAT family N-acetyltransferase [Phenylobacterium sp.]|jgi:GNAT superfamily N-acetyltransferase|uniref:GNAT family N-acetyltransferase n=1 Tax=Phenylobacterium sp. TaxID=1871053 RepID=UPI002F91C2BE
MVAPVEIRPARPEERELLGGLKLRASLAYGDLTEELTALPEAREVPLDHMAHAFVAEADGQVLGFGTVLRTADGGAELEDVFVAPEAWRRGVGAQLIAEAARRAAALGAPVLGVVANERARAFYEACGFRQVGVVETLFEPAPRMEKPLA